MPRIVSYLKSHMTQFLLLAVLLSSAVATREVAQAKYAAYLEDYINAVATGEFYFTCDYLDDITANATLSIGGWDDKEEYELPLILRNYENSLQYNKEGQDILYYITAKMYTESNPKGDTIEYNPNSDKLNKDYEARVVPKDSEIVCYYRYYDEDYRTNRYVPVMRLNGMQDFNVEAGSHDVTVTMELQNGKKEPTASQHLVVEAHTIPLHELGNLRTGTNANAGTYDSSEYKATVKDGIYHVTRKTTFTLEVKEKTIGISQDVRTTNQDYAVVYTLKCGQIKGGSGTRVRIYYDHTVMDADPQEFSGEGKAPVKLADDEALMTAHPEWKTDPDIMKLSYVEVDVNNESAKNYYFFKKSIGFTEIQKGEPALMADLTTVDSYKALNHICAVLTEGLLQTTPATPAA